MSKYICLKCRYQCSVELHNSVVPANCVLDADAPCWKEVIDLDGIFSRKDCPDWAYYAAADPDGTVRWFRNRPELALSTAKWFSAGINDICRDVVCFHPRSVCRGYLPGLPTNLFEEAGVPCWARYAVINKDGKAYLYSERPIPDADGWKSAEGHCMPYHAEDEFSTENWEQSIITRPQRFEVGDWIYNWLNKMYEQVIELNGTTVRTVKYFKGQRRHSDWHVDQIKGYFDPDPIEVKPIPEYEAYKLVGKVVRDAKGNTELITAWNVDQKKVYMDYHAVKLEDLTGWWLGDKPCGVIESEDSYDEAD